MKTDLEPVAATLLRPATPGVLAQRPPHDLACDGDEVCAIRPVGSFLIDETDVRFVDERGWRQGVPAALAAGKVSREPLELFVHGLRELIDAAAISVTSPE